MPEVADPPTETKPEYVPPQVPEAKKPLKVSYGEKWKAEFAKLQAAERETKEADIPMPPPETTEVPKEEPKPEVKEPEPELKPAAEKPASPLDVITAEKKPEIQEEPDVLKEFDEKEANWKRAREVMRQQAQAKKDLEAEIAKLKETPKSSPEEILALAKERDELKSKYQIQEERLKAVNYQYSETFQNMVADRDAHIGKIQSRVERLGGDTEKFMAALAMPDGRAKNAQIKEALSEVDPEDRTRVHTLLETLDEKNEKLAKEVENAGPRWDELQAKRAAELAEEQAKGLKTIESTFTQIAAALPESVKTFREVPDDVPGASEWNAEIKAARETAMRVLTPGGSDQKESMEIAIKGGRYDSLEKRFLSVHQELVEARKRLAQYDSGGPDFKGGDKPKEAPVKGPKGASGYFKALETLRASPTE